MDFHKILSQSTKKPQNILKIVISFSVALLVIWLFMVSRMELGNQPAGTSLENGNIENTESIRESLLRNQAVYMDSVNAVNSMAADSSLNQALNENSSAISPSRNQARSRTEVEPAEETDVFQNALTTFFVISLLLGGVWIWNRRKSESVPVQQNLVSDVGEHMLGQGAQIKFVEVNNEIWALGLNSNSVNLLHRIPRDEWKGSLPADTVEMAPNGKKDFNSIYKLFRN